jgi:Fe2+ transport system protein FeoA
MNFPCPGFSTNFDSMEQTLFDLDQSGVRARVLGFCGSPSLIERLKEMGVHQGLFVTYVGQAPFRGPKIFRIGVTVLALREEEAKCAVIEKSS